MLHGYRAACSMPCAHSQRVGAGVRNGVAAPDAPLMVLRGAQRGVVQPLRHSVVQRVEHQRVGDALHAELLHLCAAAARRPSREDRGQRDAVGGSGWRRHLMIVTPSIIPSLHHACTCWSAQRVRTTAASNPLSNTAPPRMVLPVNAPAQPARRYSHKASLTWSAGAAQGGDGSRAHLLGRVEAERGADHLLAHNGWCAQGQRHGDSYTAHARAAAAPRS